VQITNLNDQSAYVGTAATPLVAAPLAHRRDMVSFCRRTRTSLHSLVRLDKTSGNNFVHRWVERKPNVSTVHREIQDEETTAHVCGCVEVTMKLQVVTTAA
jgi:hypothetical protein